MIPSDTTNEELIEIARIYYNHPITYLTLEQEKPHSADMAMIDLTKTPPTVKRYNSANKLKKDRAKLISNKQKGIPYVAQ